MKVSVTCRGILENEAVSRDYIEEKLLKFKKYFDKPVEAHVVVALEKFRHNTEITMAVGRYSFFAMAEAKNSRAAFDEAVDKLERQIKKRMEKDRESKDSIRTVDETKDVTEDETVEE
ncbi:MAG: ribosome-associated translation inhibitor RaiA [Deltaproteobacteria bacterium]|nr:ribosome-associated translation inhibitor RaiA [Deltaproteobacteria bacterium]